MNFAYADAAKMIDHALLQPNMTQMELEHGCQLALTYDIASVCIMPYYLRRCSHILGGSTVKASTVIGFPHGGQKTAIKLAEIEQALEDGGEELDMVVNISQVLSGSWDYVEKEIRAATGEAQDREKKIKIIFENCYLQNEHKIRLCEICISAGVDWVKTSTGFGSSGATLEDLQLMLTCVQPPVQVKAAGGVRDLDMLLKVRAMGVTRCGTSRTAPILDEARSRLGLPQLQTSGGVVAGGY